jgi:hypothetical protein
MLVLQLVYMHIMRNCYPVQIIISSTLQTHKHFTSWPLTLGSKKDELGGGMNLLVAL